MREHAPTRFSWISAWGACALTIATAVSGIQTANAANVEEVVSPGGIHAYLVNEPSIPFLSMAFQFSGGSSGDPDGKEGLSYMASGLIDEGSGPYDSQAFRAELEDNAIQLSFDADRDSFSGSLKTLTENRDHAFELLRLAITEPRFDEEPVERIRQQIISDLTRRESDPEYLGARRWFDIAFAGHPYSKPTRGTIETIKAIGKDDLRELVRTRLARNNLTIGVAGDITADELGPALDEVFGSLPADAADVDLPKTTPQGDGETVVIDLDIPQSVVIFGHGGIARNDPDYYAAYVANYILGGGGFSSWLTEEVREKRGLAYSVYSYLYDTDLSPMWMGGVATRNDQVMESIRIIKEQVARMADGNVDEKNLDDARTYLTGSFPLRLTSNDQIARMLVGMQIYDLGVDYLDRRNGYIEAVTLNDVRRAAKRLFNEDMLVTIVGSPSGDGDGTVPRLEGIDAPSSGPHEDNIGD
ncbi:MAG: insulinase family protein [Geminicoccaceae bacterium]|nr:insulinase family protein [Geminicoccaceae bacterium]